MTDSPEYKIARQIEVTLKKWNITEELGFRYKLATRIAQHIIDAKPKKKRTSLFQNYSQVNIYNKANEDWQDNIETGKLSRSS